MALATRSEIDDPSFRCKWLEQSLLSSSRLEFAESPDDVAFLETANRANALLLPHGKILARKELRNKPGELFRAIVHEEIEAIMQIMALEDRSKYSALINMALGAKIRLPDKYLTDAERANSDAMDLRDAFIRLFPEESTSRITGVLLNDELLANHLIAKAVELVIARDDNLLVKKMSDEERVFLQAVEGIIKAARHNYFTGVFWDNSARESKIRVAMANGIRFAQVADRERNDNAGRQSVEQRGDTEAKPADEQAPIQVVASGETQPKQPAFGHSRSSTLTRVVISIGLTFTGFAAYTMLSMASADLGAYLLIGGLSTICAFVLATTVYLKARNAIKGGESLKTVIQRGAKGVSKTAAYIAGISAVSALIYWFTKNGFVGIFGSESLEQLTEGLANPAFMGHEWLALGISAGLLFITGIVPFIIVPYARYAKREGKDSFAKLIKNDCRYFLAEASKFIPAMIGIVAIGFGMYYFLNGAAMGLYEAIAEYSEFSIFVISPLHMVASDLASQTIERHQDAKREGRPIGWLKAIEGIDLSNTSIFFGMGFFKAIALPTLWAVTKFLIPNGSAVGWVARSVFDMAFVATMMNAYAFLAIGVKDNMREKSGFREKLAVLSPRSIQNIWFKEKWPQSSRIGGYFPNLWIAWTIEEAFCLGPNGEGGFAVVLDTLFDIPWNIYLSFVARERAEDKYEREAEFPEYFKPARLKEILNPASKLQGKELDKFLAKLRDDLKRARQRWQKAHRDEIALRPNEPLWDWIARVFYRLRLGINSSDIRLLQQTPDKVVVRFLSPCPIAAACAELGLDCGVICQRVFTPDEREMLSSLHSGLTLSKTAPGPNCTKGEKCAETIALSSAADNNIPRPTEEESIKKLYRQLSPAARAILLRPDILPVIMGVKPAYLWYPKDPDAGLLTSEMQKMPGINDTLGLLFTKGNHIVSMAYFINRVKIEGSYLIKTGILSKKEYKVLISNTANIDAKSQIVEKLLSTKSKPEDKEILPGFILGYPLEDIMYLQRIAERIDLTKDTLVTSKYGFAVFAINERVTRAFLGRWDEAIDHGYRLLAEEDGFEDAMSAEALVIFRRGSNQAAKAPFPVASGEARASSSPADTSTSEEPLSVSPEPENTLPEGMSKEWADFINSLKALGKAGRGLFAEKMSELDKKVAEYPKTGGSLIIYADDILRNAAVYDIEHTVKDILTKYNTLAGGKIIIFARNRENAEIIRQMIAHTGTNIEVPNPIIEDDLQANGDEVKETDAIVRRARARGAKEILAIIRGPVVNKKEASLAEFARSSKIPIILVGSEKALYSFAQALLFAMDAKLSNGAKLGWLITLPPIRSITDDIRQIYEEYCASLAALQAA